jgi:iron complex transport system substrate-binding protein
MPLRSPFNPRFYRAPLLLALLTTWSCTSSTGRITPRDTASPDRITYTDAIGRRLQLPRRPARIISLAPSVTEALYLVGAGDRVAGVTVHCDWPEEARKKPKIGDLLNPNAELILAARPDLVIASTAGNDRAAVLKLADLGLPVFVTAPRTVETIFETVDQIGRITGCEARARDVAARMRERLDLLDRRLKGTRRVRAFYITWFEPLLAPGRGTFENDVLLHAGVDSITSTIPDFYPRYSLEQVIASDPDVILAVRHEGNPLPDLRTLAGWQQIGAVRNNRVFLVGEALQHPSPRFLDALEDLARRLHPESFR